MLQPTFSQQFLIFFLNYLFPGEKRSWSKVLSFHHSSHASFSLCLSFFGVLSLRLTSEHRKVTLTFQFSEISSLWCARTHTRVLLATDHYRPVTQVWFGLTERCGWANPWGSTARETGGWEGREGDGDEKTAWATLCSADQSSHFRHFLLSTVVLKWINNTIILHH